MDGSVAQASCFLLSTAQVDRCMALSPGGEVCGSQPRWGGVWLSAQVGRCMALSPGGEVCGSQTR